jgi:alpha-L-arabinofuranosidase
MQEDVERCRQMIAQNAPGRNIRLAITEWNTTAGDWGLGRAMLWTLDNALACSRYHNFMHRNCDIIEIANRSNLADSFCSGIIQPGNSGLFKTPTYYAQQLYAVHAGQVPLKVRMGAGQGRFKKDKERGGDGSAARNVVVPFKDAGTSRPRPFLESAMDADDPELDVSATLAKDGHRVAIFIVNPTIQPHKRTIDLAAFTPGRKRLSVWTLADTYKAGERDAANSWREPDRIRTERSRAVVVDGKVEWEVPALSLTLLEMK